MKQIGFLILFAVLSLNCITAQSNASDKTPKASFNTDTHDFKKVAEEVGQVACTFEVTNTGTAPLIINSVRASCGCTTPSYTTQPILPGQKGEVKVAYSTTNRVGAFSKFVTVFTNVPDTTYRLNIKGEVLPRK